MIWLLTLCMLSPTALCLNVLVWNPTVAQSHVRFMGSIADILAGDGHNVTIVSPLIDPLVDMVGHTSTAIHQIFYHSKYISDDDYPKMEIKGTSLWDMPAMEGRCVTMQDIEKFFSTMRKMCRGIAEDSAFLSTLRSSHFDVAVHEVYEMSSVAIFELIGVEKTVLVSAIGMTPYVREVVGLPADTSFVPALYSAYSDDMTFWQRLDNFKLELETRFRYHFWEQEIWSLANAASPGFPDLRELLKQKTGVVLLNVNEFVETPRPTANILRYIGGLTIQDTTGVDQKLSAILDERPQNVLFSLGSFAKSADMPTWLKEDIISAFASFPNVTFIWKYEDAGDTSVFRSHENIYTMNWVPQMELLGDKRLSLFITHAGMNSVLEATHFGTPMVAIPLFSDQILNAKSLQRRGLAVVIDRRELNQNTLTAAIRELLTDSSYTRKAAAAARYLSGRPAAARAELSRWVNLVAEDELVDHLLLQSRKMSFVHYYCVDVVLYLFAQLLACLYFVVRIVRFVVTRIVVVLRKRKVD